MKKTSSFPHLYAHTQCLMLPLMCLALAAVSTTLAQNVITPTGVVAGSTNSSSTTPVNLINSAGLLGSGPILTQTVSNNASSLNMYLSAARTVGTNWVRFSLGGNCDLTGAAIWQFNASTTATNGVWSGAKDIGIYMSTVTNANTLTNKVGAFTLNQGSGTTSEAAQILSFTASNVNQIMITFSNTFGGGALTNVGLSKVRFLGGLTASIGPVNEKTIAGAHLTLLTVPRGSGTFTYQWMKEGVNLAGANAATYSITSAQEGDSGNYSVVVTNSTGARVTNSAVITVVPVPTDNVITPTDVAASTTPGENHIIDPPQSGWGLQDAHNLINGNGQNSVGGSVLSSTAGNDPNAIGMWQTDEQTASSTNWVVFDLGNPYDVSGAAIWTGNQQALLNRGVKVFGIYYATNTDTPMWNPFWTNAGSYVKTATLNRAAGGTDEPVQLLSLNLHNVRRIMFALSNVWSELYVDDAEFSEVRFLGNPLTISILQQPQSASLFVGDSYTLTVTPGGGPAYGYQWWKDGTNLLTGANSPYLVLRNLQAADAGNYTVVVTNYAGSITSSPALVTVQTVTDVTSGLVGQWKLDEISGSVAADASANHNSGTVSNGNNSQWITGEIGGAFSCFGRNNGSNYIIVANYPKPITSMSFSAWVWADGANPALNNSVIAGNWGTTNAGQFLLSLGSGGQLRGDLMQSTTTAGQVTVQESIPFPTNAWQFVAFVADGSTLHLYRNSVQVGAADYDGTLCVPPLPSVGFGARMPDAGTAARTNFWQGKLDDLALWTRPLTPNEITEIYAAGNAGQDATEAPSYPLSAPTIVQQPQSVATYPSENPTFIVQVAGTQPFSYQWWENGTNVLTSGTNNPLALLNAQTDKNGFTYTVVVTNAGGSVTSAPATLTFLVSGPTTNDFSGAAGMTPYAAKTWGSYGPTNNVLTNATLMICKGVNQTNIVVFDRTAGASGHMVAQWQMSTLPAGGRWGSCFTFLDTATYGATGNPFMSLPASSCTMGPPSFTAVSSGGIGNRWVFTNSLSIAFDGYDVNASPTSTKEVALYYNGLKRAAVLSAYDFHQGTTMVPVKAEVTFVYGGANVSVWLNDTTTVYSNYFIAGPAPYESRVAMSAVTASTSLMSNRVDNVLVTYDTPGLSFPTPTVVHTFKKELIQVFNQYPTRTFALPPKGQSYGRIIGVLTMAPPPGGMDIWDRVGQVLAYDDNGGNPVELIRFMSGYDIPWTWYVDLTDYQSLLRGNRPIQLGIGTIMPDGTASDGYGFQMSLDLIYYPGVPDLTPYKVENLWNSLSVTYGDTNNPIERFFVPRTKNIDAGVSQVWWKSHVSGHGETTIGNAAEFMATWRLLHVTNALNQARIYSNYLWKTDNYLTPASPQSGTWTYSRAGWGPGCAVNGNGTGGWETNITAAVTPGGPATFGYEVMPWVNPAATNGQFGQATFSVNSTLISYRTTLLVPTVWYTSTNLFLSANSGTCQALLPDLTLTNFLVQSDVSPVTVTQDPPANTPLPIGTTVVTLSASDTLGNTTNGTITVVVADTAPPIVTTPGALVLTNECHTPFIDPGATATDDCSGIASFTTNSTVNANAPGVYTVQYVAVDGSGNAATNTRTVYVVDTMPPAITQCVPAQILELGTSLPDLTGLIAANDACSAALTVQQVPAPGTMLPLGVSGVVFRVDDGNGNTNTCSTSVTVQDTVAPLITRSFTSLILAADTNCQALMLDVTGTNYVLATDFGSLTVTQSVATNTVLAVGTTNEVVLGVVDGSGNASYTTNQVVVLTIPVVTLLGAGPLTNECHAAFIEPGATAQGDCAAVVSLSTNGTVDADAPGLYAIEYVAVDANGNSATATRNVYVVDTTPPAITLNGANPMAVECHMSYQEPGATASDACAGAVSVRISGTVDPNTPSSYTVTYTADDGNGNTNSATRTVNVADTIGPVITLNGANPMAVECHMSYQEPGATASDACAGAVSVRISGAVDANTPNSYTVTYTADDGNGNTSTVTRTVNVADTIGPVITLNGANPMAVECHTSYQEPGATASDACTGPVSVTVSGTVDANTPSSYTVTYTADDGNGNTNIVTRTVNVADTIGPMITLNGANPMAVECHTSYQEAGATASDACAGVVSVTISGAVDANTPNSYAVTYTADDGNGNTNSLTRTVNVVDTIGPVITLTGANPMAVECHTSYQEPGATASDACAGPVSVRASGAVDANTPNSYTVTYTADDGNGNTNSVTRTVNVADTIGPAITLNGANPMAVECHTSYQEPGATASDTCAGAVSVRISGVVDANTPNSYTVTYTADDGNGNTNSVTRTVNVADTIGPVITLNGANPMAVECHTSYQEPGATASDACAGAVSVRISGALDPNTPNSYTVTYTADDGNGNTNSVTRTVNVADTIGPVITLNGANPMTNYNYVPFTDPGASAFDDCAGGVAVMTNGTVNVAALGVYTLEYVASDPAGNSTTNTRIVRVVALVAPAIQTATILGDGRCRLVFSGPAGQSYRVLAALGPDRPASDWDEVASGTFGDGEETFIDDDSTMYPTRFYRIVSP